MKLRKLVIENYRSLERVEIEDLQDVNIFIGKNNSGKSSIFQALVFLRDIFPAPQNNQDPSIRTEREIARDITFEMTFDLSKIERESYLNGEFSRSGSKIEGEEHSLISSNFLKSFCVKYCLSKNSYLEFFLISGFSSETIAILKQSKTSDGLILDMKNEDQGVDSFIKKLSEQGYIDIQTPYNQPFNSFPDQIISFFLTKISNYLNIAYHFNIIRKSDLFQPVQEIHTLSTDGKNLAGVLFTLKNKGSGQAFQKIKDFLTNTIFDIPIFNSHLIGNNTMLGFGEFVESNAEPLKLNEVGSGIEQVLLVATALETAPPNAPIFLEEPESYLHPGAQRYLLEQLAKSGRQVFITTHSNVFLGDIGHSDRTSIYRVSQANRRTQVTRVDDTALSEALQDIGVRNSDVLLRDALIFVEDINDEKVFQILAEKLEKPLAGKNLGFVSMGGASAIHSAGKLSSEALTQLQQGSKTIPHLFVIDHDERSNEEISELQEKLGEQLQVLEQRELENYLLVAKPLQRYIKNYESGTSSNPKDKPKRELATVVEIEALIREFVDKQKNILVVKNVAAQIRSGHPISILERDDRDKITKLEQNESFPDQIASMVRKNLMDRARIDELPNTIKAEQERIETVWKDESKRIKIASGFEVLRELLIQYGIPTKKLKSQLHEIAKHFEKDDIAPDLAQLLSRIYSLSNI
jgi:predicted ATP-dependent endonuclease of OLD family